MLPQATSECRFCLGNGLMKDQPLFSNDSCYFLPNIDPVLKHSGMVIPFRHSTAPFDLNQTEWRDTFNLMARAKAHFDAFEPDGFTIGWNVGPVGGQTIGHVHLHVIARFDDEPLAGQGLRHHIKHPENRRRGSS